MSPIIFLPWMSAVLLLSCNDSPVDRTGQDQTAAVQQNLVGGPCEDCELMLEGMPALTDLSNEAVIASTDEPGDRMVLTGTVWQPDGRTPAPDIVVYLYHTDATGRYTPSTGQDDGRRHGHLRGWIRTDADGKFSVHSIRPAAYPSGRDPAHIHMLVKEPDKGIYWIDAIQFDGDPLLTPGMRARQEDRGGDMIVSLEKDPAGAWSGSFTITLGKNVPGYK